jgi:hypothetical protein
MILVESRANKGHMIVYNNYIYAGGHLLPGGNPYINAGYCRWYGYNEHPLSFWIHNTLVTANGGESPLVMEYMAFFKNNIMHSLVLMDKVQAFGVSVSANSTDPAWCGSCNPPCLVTKCNNNLIWREWDDVSFTGQFSGLGKIGTPSGWLEWISYGGRGVNKNPQFVNNVRNNKGYVIDSKSPAINASEDLRDFIESKGLPWTDIEGNPRGKSPDIGAYECTEEYND